MPTGEPDSADLTAGAAGVGIGHLMLFDITGDPLHRAVARRYAEYLLERLDDGQLSRDSDQPDTSARPGGRRAIHRPGARPRRVYRPASARSRAAGPPRLPGQCGRAGKLTWPSGRSRSPSGCRCGSPPRSPHPGARASRGSRPSCCTRETCCTTSALGIPCPPTGRRVPGLPALRERSGAVLRHRRHRQPLCRSGHS